MAETLTYHHLDNEALFLKYFQVPWDTEICGFPVAQIDEIVVRRKNGAAREFSTFLTWCEEQQIRFCSCRLDSIKMQESALLEVNGFRFIEMNYQPRLDTLESMDLGSSADTPFIEEAGPDDLEDIVRISGSAFSLERFHVDPELGPHLGNKRYRTWAASSFGQPSCRFYKVMVQGRLAGFFLVEEKRQERLCHWLLTALAPEFHGQGLGSKVWRSMLRIHQQDGMQGVQTTISARNTAVLAIYTRLGFFLPPPVMTFHWHLTA